MAFLDYKFDWKWDDADHEFKRAIELNPKYALAHHWYGEFLKLRLRPDEATREFRRALEVDPLSIPIRYDYVESLLSARRIADARAILNEMTAIDPNGQRVFMAAADVLEAEGRVDESVDTSLRGQLVGGASEREVDSERAVYRAGGEPALKRRRLDRLLAQLKPGAVPGPGVLFATSLTEAYAENGDVDQTLHWLVEATNLDEDAPLLSNMHLFDFVRSDPRFMAIQKRVGLRP